METKKKIETYEKVMRAVENILAFEKQTGFIKNLLFSEDKELQPKE